MNNKGYGYIPDWLLPLMGERERQIHNSDDWVLSNYDEDYPNNRLPRGIYNIVDRVTGEHFTIDSQQKRIIG